MLLDGEIAFCLSVSLKIYEITLTMRTRTFGAPINSVKVFLTRGSLNVAGQAGPALIFSDRQKFF